MLREHLSDPAADPAPQATHISSATDAAPARIVISDAQLLFGGQFKKAGGDLIITGNDGHKIVVAGYFDFDRRPDLVTEQGAGLSAHVIERLAVSSTPGQYAQVGAPAGGGIVIGKVERLCILCDHATERWCIAAIVGLVHLMRPRYGEIVHSSYCRPCASYATTLRRDSA